MTVDVGTSGARAAAYDLDGHRRLEVRRAYPTSVPHPGWAEQDPRAWRSAGLAAIAEVVRRLGPRGRVHAIGLTGQCPSVVLVDAAGRPVTPGLIYRDNRASREADELRARFGDAAIHRRTGHLPAAFHIGPKLAWIRHHDPAAWRRAALVLQPRDWLALTLTGEAATDGTHAAATLLYDIAARSWSGELAAALGVPDAWLPPLRPSDAVLGTLRPAIADRLGLAAATPVVLGGADSQACALGAGVVTPGTVSEMAGSSTCLNAVVPAVVDQLGITHYPHVVGRGLVTETGINTTGASVAWWADLAYGGRGGRAASADYEALDAEAALARAAADGVLALAVLGDGERTDPALRGAITGLSLRHGRAVVARALLEGVAFAIRDQIDLLRSGGVAVRELRVSGGSARLATWNQVKADVTGLPVRSSPGDAAAGGVAILAGLGAGLYGDPATAIERCVHLDPPLEPDPALRAMYDEAFGRYRELLGSRAVRAPG